MDYNIDEMRDKFYKLVDELISAFKEWDKTWIQSKPTTANFFPEKQRLIKVKKGLNEALDELLK